VLRDADGFLHGSDFLVPPAGQNVVVETMRRNSPAQELSTGSF
jgi:hypothetical protein